MYWQKIDFQNVTKLYVLKVETGTKAIFIPTTPWMNNDSAETTSRTPMKAFGEFVTPCYCFPVVQINQNMLSFTWDL